MWMTGQNSGCEISGEGGTLAGQNSECEISGEGWTSAGHNSFPGGMSYAARRKGDRLRVQGRESHVTFFREDPTLLAFRICIWQRTSKLRFFMLLSFPLLFHGFQRTLLNLGLLWWSKAIKTPKLNTIWLELIARVLNMLIGLKCDNYYSKVFTRVNYKLSNNTF